MDARDRCPTREASYSATGHSVRMKCLTVRYVRMMVAHGDSQKGAICKDTLVKK
jgi:hypothetical protein